MVVSKIRIILTGIFWMILAALQVLQHPGNKKKSSEKAWFFKVFLCKQNEKELPYADSPIVFAAEP